MKQYFIFIVLICYSVIGSAQTFERQKTETADQFIKRITQRDELPHPVIETKEWDSLRKVIIYFTNVEKEDEEIIVGYLLVLTNELSYKRILIDTFYTDGGSSSRKIESVFFANVNIDKDREIVVMTSSEAKSPRFADNNVEGVYYDTYIYDKPNLNNPTIRLKFYNDLSAKFSDNFEGTISDRQTGKLIKTKKAKYKTVSSVRAGLKQMGY